MTPEKSMERNCKEQPETAVDGTKHTVRTTEKKILHRKLISTRLKSQIAEKSCFVEVTYLETTQRKKSDCFFKSTESGGNNNFRVKTEASDGRIRKRWQRIRILKEIWRQDGTCWHRQGDHWRTAGTRITTEQIGETRNIWSRWDNGRER